MKKILLLTLIITTFIQFSCATIKADETAADNATMPVYEETQHKTVNVGDTFHLIFMQDENPQFDPIYLEKLSMTSIESDMGPVHEWGLKALKPGTTKFISSFQYNDRKYIATEIISIK